MTAIPCMRASAAILGEADDSQSSDSGRIGCEVVDPLVLSDWDRLVQGHPDSSVFHTSTWASVLAKSYGHRAAYLRITEQGRLMALVPIMEVSSILTRKRGVGLPFTDVCRPLLFNGCSIDQVVEQIVITGRSRGWKHVELRDA